ncbi:hypothetical protein CVD25_13065 [Bacillus canaveralius]|uniref:VanZ-like domain-containing protein n=1 Tax=Bacillus canaveralius TaxID=1403243 RepID=A0A2N5GNE6_9BACI|nr:VanZ family protein [Bacillus canaveralius]PLR84035.1 hypothetical protein CU635_06940 [Bacillus canaveralius]PLR96320.1 hypothetical protein CVD25_13065 [Bacillus canaveralius]
MQLLFKRFILLFFLLAYMLFIWLQSSYFNPESVSSSLASIFSLPVIWLIGAAFEFAHLFEFGLLYLFIIMVFLSFGEFTNKKDYMAITIAFLYGFIDEIHQVNIPYRSASVGDLIKNTIGIIFVWWIIHKYYLKNRNSKIGRILTRITQSSQGV